MGHQTEIYAETETGGKQLISRVDGYFNGALYKAFNAVEYDAGVSGSGDAAWVERDRMEAVAEAIRRFDDFRHPQLSVLGWELANWLSESPTADGAWIVFL